MQFIAGLVLTIQCIACYDISPAKAQVSEAASALGAAVGQAKRLLRGSYASRQNVRRSRRRAKSDAETQPPPPPSQKPKRMADDPPSSRTEKAARPNKAAGAEENKQPAGAEAPAPDIWSKSEVAAAVRSCQKVLKTIKAKFVLADPVKRGPCGKSCPLSTGITRWRRSGRQVRPASNTQLQHDSGTRPLDPP